MCDAVEEEDDDSINAVIDNGVYLQFGSKMFASLSNDFTIMGCENL